MSTTAPRAESASKPIYLVSYPKIILLYPTFLVGVLCAIGMHLCKPDSASAANLALFFLGVFLVNTIVMAFDFPRTTSLTLFFLIAAIIMGGMLLFRNYPDLLPFLTRIISHIEPHADATFYWCFTAILAGIYLAVFINLRFDYWEIRDNELLHHHGFLSNLERYSAPNLRISKEIDDVFEYLLLRSGRLILHPSNEPRVFVLENVPFIDQKETAITKMLGVLQVSVTSTDRPDAAH